MGQRRKSTSSNPAKPREDLGLGNGSVAEAANPVGTAAIETLREAMRLHVGGRLADAVPVYRRYLAMERSPIALNNLGAALRDLGKSGEALECFRESLTLDAGYADGQLNLGLALADVGDLTQSEAVLTRALTVLPNPSPTTTAVDPRYLQAVNGYGSVLRRQGRVEEMLALYRRVAGAAPKDANLWVHLGNVLYETHRLEEAASAYNTALSLDPVSVAALGNLGTVYSTLGKLDEAVHCQRAVIGIEPENPKHFVNLGAALKGKGLLGEAAAAYRRAIELKPDYDYAINNLGNLLREQGQLSESIACFRRAIEISPDYLSAHSNLLFTLNSMPTMTPAEIYAEHRKFGELVEAKASVRRDHDNVATPDRVLRIGYLSPDFLGHSVAYFIENLLEFHDRRQVEIVCYALNKRMDSLSKRLQSRASLWRSCSFMTDDELDSQIRADRIDILVDLAGHTAENRQTVMARKPAPIGVTYLGYPNTTGLTTIDYRLTDADVDPPGEADEVHSEQLVRLPHGFLCFRPSDFAGDVPPRPVAKNGYVTFGSFNVMAKMTDEVIATWARILLRVPKSRLIMKCNAFTDAETVELYRRRFKSHGIAEERLDLLGRQPLIGDHLATYGRIDIALDPFPYNGTTTTCEALWMGVPMIALRGTRHVGRVSAALLSQLQLGDLVAVDVDDYVEVATRLALDPGRIQAISAQLRPVMAASPLMDGPGFARDVEAAFRQMWLKWCLGRGEVMGEGRRGLASFESRLSEGVDRFNRGDWSGAERAFRIAIGLQPSSPEAVLNLGTALKRLKRLPEALACFQRAVALRPDWAPAYANLGSVHCDLGQQAEAEVACRRAILIDPSNRNAYSNLASAIAAQRREQDAIPYFEKALEIGPPTAELFVNLSAALLSAGQLAKAAEACRRAISLQPNLAEAHANLASTLGAQGLGRETIAASREVTRLKPDMHLGWSNLLFALNYADDMTADQVFEEHRAWGGRFTEARLDLTRNPADASRRLRVGFVSADFCAHSVAFFLKPLFDRHDRSELEFYCYSDVVNPDLYTDLLRNKAEHWRQTAGFSDEHVADLVREDRIDILVDLAGHTSKNRLMVFAARAAPVQVTWLGYPNTTGLVTMDYRLVDGISDPVGAADRQHTEALWRLRAPFLCYDPPPQSPDVGPLPAGGGGQITFGSFNKINKISDFTLGLWAGVLAAVPNSRLILKSRSFGDMETASRLRRRFRDLGIDDARVELLDWEPHLKSHLEVYNRVDLALDTYPYNGTTTICEAAWMGVPTLTLCGDRHAARVGTSINLALRLPQYTAADATEFVSRAKVITADIPALAELRQGLRDRMLASPLCDAAEFSSAFGRAMREMWQNWCRLQSSESDIGSEEAAMIRVPANMLKVRLKGEVDICVPRNLDLISPYVLLEQEDWFEDEAPFIRRLLRSGDKVVDIGANYGVYSLTAAKAVGDGGHVWSFEPASETAAHLSQSIAANGFKNVTLIQAALSNREGQAQLSLSGQSELNTLQGSAAGSETVSLTTLDAWAAGAGWPKVDFMKLDAEGEEGNVIRGGENFLRRASPLVMFEIKHGSKLNLALQGQLTELGYAAYRLLPGIGILRPFHATGSEDPYLLNLFACKPDKAAELAERGILAEAPVIDIPAIPEGAWKKQLSAMPYARDLTGQWLRPGVVAADYGNALDAYCLAHESSAPAPRRAAALEVAVAAMRRLSEGDPRFCYLLSLARAASEAGQRAVGVLALQRLVAGLAKGQCDPSQPFLAPSERFENLPMAGKAEHWCFAAILETFERLSAYSSFYDPNHASILDDLRKTGLQSVESERRRILIGLRKGIKPKEPLPSALLRASSENLNPEFWQAVEKPVPAADNLLELLPLTSLVSIVDIGAMALGSETEPYRPLIRAGKARVVGFEPNEAECAKLNQGTGGKYYPYFIGDGSTRTFHETNMAMTGSLYAPNTPLLAKFTNLAELVTPKMQHPGIVTRRLDDLGDLDGLSDIDLIKIDVQGAELDVFQGAARALSTALMIITEVEFVELYVGQPLFGDVDGFLRKNGYQFHTFMGFGQRFFKPLSARGNPSAGLRQILWSDAVFVRDFMQFEKLADEKLLKLAILLDTVLQSVDLAALALREYDRRNGSSYADSYVGAIIGKASGAKSGLPQ